MSLSSDVISQFVKLNNQSGTKTKTKTTLIGIVNDPLMRDATGKVAVTLDGSSEITYATTGVSVAAGNKVFVEIENHSASITSNISDPSASTTVIKNIQADSVTTVDFQAEIARIDTLNANVASINQELEAQSATINTIEATTLSVDKAESTYAKIENLDATNARVTNLETKYGEFDELFTERLDAAEANIEDLSTNKLDAATAEITYAKIADLDATYAKITDLDAANADIDTLETDVADINTLIFGSASGDVIQTTFANAVIAQLGDAQIKSAMIENLSASKMTSGDIITNNVRVKSEDGSLLISDETMQISDATRVRVQIGKDASGDYSINIWDADGNLMFSKGGITDNAIKDAIIRNEMVSDTANIAAHKLDIDSLFEEINGSTNTIKSTQIYLDDQKQTLDVAFETVTTDIENLQNDISTQGTQITAIQGQITTKVWQSDIDTATNTLSTQYSELEQEVDGISTTVASHTATLSNKADSSDVTDLEDRVESAETKISQNETSITSVANRTTAVENAFDNYSTTEQMNSAITQSAEGITSSVSETYATKQNLTDDIAYAQSYTGLVEERVTTAETLIEQLSDCIAVLVTDANGESLMTQTDEGWTFSTAHIQSIVDTTSEGLDSLTNEMGDVNATVDALQQAVTDLGILNDYVKIGTYESEPCIELGETDSDFKLLITNTRIMFMEGTGVPAYINNQSLYIKKAIIEEELQQGEFVWKVRSNGNLGLVWKGVTS